MSKDLKKGKSKKGNENFNDSNSIEKLNENKPKKKPIAIISGEDEDLKEDQKDDENKEKRHGCNDEDGHGTHPDADLIVVEIASCLAAIGQNIVAHFVQRLQQHGNNASKRTIRCKQLHKSAEASQQTDYKQPKDSIT